MPRAVWPFFFTVLGSWVALLIAAQFYSQSSEHSHWITAAALPGFMLEAVFYLASGFQQTRAWFRQSVPTRWQPALLWISALLPYVVFSLLAGTFNRNAFLLLSGLTAVLAFWHAAAPRRLIYDAGFLFIAAAAILSGVFKRIYISPDNHIPMDILGHLMWIRVAIAALLILREWNPGPVGFWPKWEEWKTGAAYYLLAVVPVLAIGLTLRFVQFAPRPGPWWRVSGIAIGTFFGILWVVAFSEELFFRGVIQRALLDRWKSPAMAIIVSAILYGSVHLWMRHFPNWQWMLLTVVLGIVFGLAYARTGSIRGPMVAHALVVTTWRMLLV